MSARPGPGITDSVPGLLWRDTIGNVPYVTTKDGAKLAIQVSGDGYPLVLLPGQSNNHHWWDCVRPDFADRYRTITFDYRGTGDSDKPDEPYTTRGFVRDLLAVLDELGVERAHVYGASMGGKVAQWLAVDHPERVAGLVLGCTSSGGAQAVERSREVRRLLAQRGVAAKRALLELMYTPQWLAEHPGPHRTIGDRGMPAHARRHHFAASTTHDSWEALPGITAPTLVIHGADDVFNPAANAPLLAARIPGARLHLIPGARHAYFEEFREVSSRVVLDFLAEVPLS